MGSQIILSAQAVLTSPVFPKAGLIQWKREFGLGSHLVLQSEIDWPLIILLLL